jgi:hypothetical protein
MRTHLLVACVLTASCGPGAVPIPTAAPVTLPPARETAAAMPTVLWTSPPLVPAPPAPSATASPQPAPTPAPVVVTPAPAPTARPTATPRPSPTEDPFKWTAYDVNGGPVIYLPAAWTVIDPKLSLGAFAFIASPEPPRSSFADYGARVTVNWYSATPTLNLDAFANAYASTLAPFHAARNSGSHASGPTVLFTYVDSARYRHVDAIFSAGGRIAALAARAPIDRWPSYGATFEQVYLRFRPG